MIDELERLAQFAARGPWSESLLTVTDADGRKVCCSLSTRGDYEDEEPNARYIAAASPDVMAKLIAVVRAAEAYVGPDFEPDAGTRGAALRQSLAALKANA